MLGGDGTMLRALNRFLGTGLPVIGVNFGRVGFLCTIAREALEPDLRRVFGGELQAVKLATLEVELGDETNVAVNDVVVTSSELGRMIELEWAAGGEDLGRVPVRRAHLLDPVGLDRVQPLEWRPRPDVGDRCAGGDLRRAAFAPRATRRRSAWLRPRDLESHDGGVGDRARRRPRGWRARVRAPGPRCAWERGSRCSERCPDSTFVSRYRRVFAA